jgi:arabinogalactan oligomer/maltooligosaccharide transport system substrate-binding protein
MRKSKRILALSLAMAMSATCFTACGGGDDDGGGVSTPKPAPTLANDTKVQPPEQFPDNPDAKQIKLKVWAPAEEKNVVQGLCQQFDGAHPEFKIEFEFGDCAEPSAYEQVSKDPTTAADVFYFANDQLANLRDGGYIAKVPAEIKDRITPQLDDKALASCTVDGDLYSFPFTANLWYLYYNKSLFEGAGVDISSLDSIINANIAGCDYNFSIPLNNGWYIGGFFLGENGCTLFGPDGTDPRSCDWANDTGVAIVKYLVSLQKSNKMYKDDGNGDTIGLLKEGKCASFCTGSWNAVAIKEALGDNYAACKLPSFTFDLNGTQVTKTINPFGDYKSIGVNSQTQEPLASFLLAEFLVSDYAQEQRLKVRSMSPTSKVVMQLALDGEYNDPGVVANIQQAEQVVPRPTISQLAQYWSGAASIGSHVVKLTKKVQDDASIKAMLENAVANITAVKE